MIDVTLTDADFIDLRSGHTINVMDVDGGEHDLGPDDLTQNELDLLGDGNTLTVGNLRIAYPE